MYKGVMGALDISREEGVLTMGVTGVVWAVLLATVWLMVLATMS
jgi:hypothetical protein